MGGLRLGSIAGVEVRIDWSLLIIFALVTFTLGAQVFPSWHPDWIAPLRWGVALVAAVAFFASVLAHEMSHALVGRRQGIPVRTITLFLFGGMAHMEKQPPTPKSELLMAAVGPAVSILIGAGATFIAGALMGEQLVAQLTSDPAAALAQLSPGETVLLWLGPINIMLGVFNLVPGFPLDGGRVFRALAWWATGDMLRATRWATGAGKAVAVLLMLSGVAMMFGVYIPFLGTGFGSGIWLLLIGWFLLKAAQLSYEQLIMRRALEGVTVAQLMRHRVAVVSPDTTIQTLMREYVMQSDQDAFPVVRGDELVGSVDARRAMAVDSELWPTTLVSDIMTGASQVPTVQPNADVSKALELLQIQQVGMLPVVEHHTVRGSLHLRDVFKWMALRDSELRERAAT